jgi:uncharacterized membrane protein YphA (DoxX/SURF4 family)
MTAPSTPRSSIVFALRRLGFRFVAAYLIVYNATAFMALVPQLNRFSYYPNLGWRYVVQWTERVLLGFHTPSSIRMTGSGDTTFLWIQNGCELGAALAAALVWSCFDRRRRRDPMVSEVLRVCVRYALAATLISYGLTKILPPTQFPPPHPNRLLEPVGQLSPMGMLWIFMGASRAYTAFSGIMETIAALLLLWRRTTPLGAIVSTAVTLNIVVLNFCYDVPVKLYSTNLLLMSLFLLWPDARRLACVLVLNRPAEAPALAPPWTSRWARIAAAGMKILVLGTILTGQFQYYLYKQSAYPQETMPASLAPLSGLWEVDTFMRDGAEVPPLLTDGTRWRRIYLGESYGVPRVFLFAVDHPIGSWGVSAGSGRGRLLLRPNIKEKGPVTMTYRDLGWDRLQLKGEVEGHPLVVDIHRADEQETRLFTRGFHWINETPFNR